MILTRALVILIGWALLVAFLYHWAGCSLSTPC